jgi:hypothetical protein
MVDATAELLQEKRDTMAADSEVQAQDNNS